MTDLITLAQAKNWLNLGTEPTTDDTLIQAIVDGASQQFLSLTTRAGILQATYTDLLDGNGRNKLALLNTPIISVASLTINGAAIQPSTGYTVPGYVIEKNQLVLVGGGACFPWSPIGFPGIFLSGTANVAVTYDAGFATVPADVQQCVWEMVGWAYKNKDRIGVSTQRFADNLSNSYAQMPFSPMAKLTIQNYSRKGLSW